MKQRCTFAINYDEASLGLFGLSVADQTMWYKRFTYSQWLPSLADWLLVWNSDRVRFDSVRPSAGVKGVQLANTVDTDVFGVDSGGRLLHTLMQGGLGVWPPRPAHWDLSGGTFASCVDAGYCLPGVGGAESSLALVGIDIGNHLQFKLIVVSTDPGDFQSTNPTYPPGTPDGVETNWIQLVGSEFIYEPATPTMVAGTSPMVDVYAVRVDGQMMRLQVNTTQWPPAITEEQLGDVCFGSAPAVVAWDPSRADVFATTANGFILWRPRQGGSWLGNWLSLGAPFGGGTFDSAPAAVSWGPNRLDVFGVASDAQMYHRYFDGRSWPQGWESLGAPAKGNAFVSAPAAVSWGWGGNRLHVFGLGTDQQVYHRYWEGKAWLPPYGWEPLGGPPLTSFGLTHPTPVARVDFGTDITFQDDTPVGGRVDITLFVNGTWSISGYLHDSGAPNYACSLACAIIDSSNRAYTFQLTVEVYGDLPGPRTVLWSHAGGPNNTLQQNWTDVFPCARFNYLLNDESDPFGGLVDNVSTLLNEMAPGAALTVIPLFGQGP
jgi:hypothetical protein